MDGFEAARDWYGLPVMTKEEKEERLAVYNAKLLDYSIRGKADEEAKKIGQRRGKEVWSILSIGRNDDTVNDEHLSHYRL
jgi:hypothetical protein